MLTDLPLSELRHYVPDVIEPADFDEFWSGQLATARSAARPPGHRGPAAGHHRGSQGGGLAIAAAHLAPGVRAAMPDVPFLAHPRRGAEITNSRPYAELAEYCAVHSDQVETVFRTLSYASDT